ncbi:intersectin-1 isoform X2 [Hermetia illucens]|uniref:intersectin-1 isoform X2 n=1 Tax=Hermetia illucens TaxID=343691 RepID=UPI0018CC18D5|nr:intersectin-1 isoform X2 [Hermetia illucens]
MNINNVDIWGITAREKIKFQQQFKSLQPQNGIVTGAQAKGFFLQSQLPPIVLGQIWALADTDADGKMNIQEFSIACKLINLKLRGFELPKVLPPVLLASLSSASGTPSATPTGSLSPLDPLKKVDAIGTAPLPTAIIQPQQPPLIPPMAVAAPMGMPRPVPPMVPQQPLVPGTHPPLAGAPQIPLAQSVGMVPGVASVPAGMVPIQPPLVPASTIGIMGAATVPPVIPPAIPPQPTVMPTANASLIDTTTKIVSPPTAENSSALPAPPTPPQSNPPSRNMSISERAPSIESPQVEWAIKGPIKLKYTQLFNTTDRTRSGFLTGAQARNIMVQTKLPQATLAQIWALSDMDSDGRLGCEEFVLAMYLCEKGLAGEKIPVTLPPDLIPPTFRKGTSRQGSIAGSRHGSQPGSRHASISSQGATAEPDPAAGLPQTSFEDKRKENFDKGQAELDRRRKLLLDQQRKEQEERERKEREEAEKREKARLEAERKQQEELERQLQRQREIEQEKEEQRRRALEAKEAARKELERQRQIEWENQRISEMQLQRQREQEKVLKLKAQNQTLNIELSTLNEKIKELSQKICDTRAGVTNVKTVIDGMRSTRDTQMSEMAQFKARIKEQNQKLLQLTQEKAKWDSKMKMNQFADAANQEQMNAAFANKQIIINQLKDKIENIKVEIETKKTDIDSNNVQMTELKAELETLIEKCEELYKTYDQHRTQVLELKNNKKNESYNAAWETAANAWPTEPEVTTNNMNVSYAEPAHEIPNHEGYIKHRAIYEFNARNPDEISFQPGDIVYVPIEQNAEPGWLAGEINGHTGWFPESYVEKIDDTSTSNMLSSINTQDTYIDNNRHLDNIAEVTETTTISNVNANDQEQQQELTYNGDVEYYVAMYPYESAEVGDLNFNAGEIIMVTKKEGDWWTGTIGTRVGIFPSNFVQKTDVSDNNATPAVQEAEITTNNTTTEVMEEKVEIHESNTGKESLQQITSTLADDAKNQEDLDTEVSQINTQQKNADQTQETYSRPMSRTSSMTPGMRGKKPEIAQVIAPYESTSPEQLSLQRGQLIMIRKKTDSGWWEGELQAKGRRRQVGWFPASYVKILQGGRNSGRNTPVSGSKIEMTETILDKVIALYPYKAQNDDELSFDKDDIISVLGRDEPEWWRGELNGLTGLFPSNYVKPFVSSGKKTG